jgi:hypothetical protein
MQSVRPDITLVINVLSRSILIIIATLAFAAPAVLILIVGQGACLGRQDANIPLRINSMAAAFNLIGDITFTLFLGWLDFCHLLTLKGPRGSMYNLYTPHEIENHSVYIYGFETIFRTLSYVKEKIKIHLCMMLMIKTPSAFLHPRRPRVSI